MGSGSGKGGNRGTTCQSADDDIDQENMEDDLPRASSSSAALSELSVSSSYFQLLSRKLGREGSLFLSGLQKLTVEDANEGRRFLDERGRDLLLRRQVCAELLSLISSDIAPCIVSPLMQLHAWAVTRRSGTPALSLEDGPYGTKTGLIKDWGSPCLYSQSMAVKGATVVPEILVASILMDARDLLARMSGAAAPECRSRDPVRGPEFGDAAESGPSGFPGLASPRVWKTQRVQEILDPTKTRNPQTPTPPQEFLIGQGRVKLHETKTTSSDAEDSRAKLNRFLRFRTLNWNRHMTLMPLTRLKLRFLTRLNQPRWIPWGAGN